MEQLTSRVWYLPHDTQTDRPVLGYLRGDRRSILIDAGNSPQHAALLCASLKAAGLTPPDDIVLTHRHWDHTFGLSAFSIPAIACHATQKYLTAFSAIHWDESSLSRFLDAEGIREFSQTHIHLEYPALSQIQIRPADLVFDRQLELSLGGCHCILKTLTSSHSDDCIFAYVPEEQVLFLGDAGCEACVHGAWIDDQEKLRREIEELEPLNFTWCINGHTPPMSRDALFVWLKGRLKR